MRKIMFGLAVISLLFLVGAVVFRFGFAQSWQEKITAGVSEATKIKGKIRVAGDNYLGYWFITSQEFKIQLGKLGYVVEWSNDGGNYAERHQKFGQSEYDMMVLPVNSYIFHGEPNYPGVIVAAISDSKGADNIVGYRDKLTGGVERPVKINDLNNPALRIALTPDSPSSFLLDVATVYFDLNQLNSKGSSFVEVNGSEEAYKKLAEPDPQKRQVDAAILWEPNVSQALQIPGVVSVFGSDQIAGMIIDVFVARKDVLLQKPEMIEAFFEAYFKTLKYYNANRDVMIQEMAKTTAFKTEEAVKRALERIAWFDLETNYNEWFGVGASGILPAGKSEKIIRTVNQVSDVMMKIGELQSDPLRGNPYGIVSNKVLEHIYGKIESESLRIGAPIPGAGAFSLLPDTDWLKLRVVGIMRVLPITFDASTSRLTLDGAKVVDEAATLLVNNFPQYRILVRGHSAPSGDETANVALSQERADLIENYLLQIHGIDSNRVKAIGVGSSEPLPRGKNEPERAYRNRLARVEFILLED